MSEDARVPPWTSPLPSSMPIRDAYAQLTMVLVTASEEHAAAVRTILHRGAGLLPLSDGATLSGPPGLVPDRREAWASLIEAIRVSMVGASGEPTDADRFQPVRAGDWETVLVSLLLARDWPTIERVARDLTDEERMARNLIDEHPRTGESTAPLTGDQVATLTELIRAGDRAVYDDLCGALGVVNGPGLWTETRRRLGERARPLPACPICGADANETSPPGCPAHLV